MHVTRCQLGHCVAFSIVTAWKLACSLLQYLKKGVIKQEEEVLAGLSQEVGGHVVRQLPGMHALHAGPASIHPVQIVQSLNDGNSSIQVHRVLGCLCQACQDAVAQHKLAVDVSMYCSIGRFARPSQSNTGTL